MSEAIQAGLDALCSIEGCDRDAAAGFILRPGGGKLFLCHECRIAYGAGLHDGPLAISSKGGSAKGKSKARSSAQARRAVKARWAKVKGKS